MANGEYYTQEQAMKKLALSKDDLVDLVREGKLREFRVDGQPNYKVKEIDTLAMELNPTFSNSDDESSFGTGSDSAIELLPADASDGGTDVLSLEETGEPVAPVNTPSKEDTVITPAGVNVFDEDELAGLDADPMAKTQIAHSISDELQIEGSGSGGGSGLLDMTRESDDTSLGAELLDEIYSGEETQPDKAPPELAGQPESFEQISEPAAPAVPRMVVQVEDPWAGLFSGLLIGACAVLLFAGFVTVGLVQNTLPGFVGSMASMWYLWLIIAVVISGIGAGAGYFLGKRVA